MDENQDSIIAELQYIRASLDSDEYEPGGTFTLGGPTGTYVVRSPFNTECEYAVLAVSGTGTGLIAVSGSNPAIAVPSSTGGTSYGLMSSGEDNNALDGYILSVGASLGQTPELFFQPLGKGANVYVSVSVAVSTAGFVVIAFRRKLARTILQIPRQRPHTHTPLSARQARTYRTETHGDNEERGRDVPPGTRYKHAPAPGQETGRFRRTDSRRYGDVNNG